MPNSNKEKKIIEYFEPVPGEPLPKRLIVQDNKLVNCTWPDLNVWESRIFFAALALIHKKDEKTMLTKLPISELERIYNVRVNKYDSIIKANKSLIDKKFSFEDDKGAGGIPLFQFGYATHDLKNGYIMFKINELLENYLLNLKSNFTKAEFVNFINLNVKNSKQLYLIIRSKLVNTTHKKFTISFDDLNKKLNKNYKSFSQLDRAVISKCIKEINKFTDLNVKYIALNRFNRKASKNEKVTAIEFTIVLNNIIEGNYNLKDREHIIVQLQKYGKLNIKVLDDLIDEYSFDTVKEEMEYALENVNGKKNIKNKIGFIIQSVKDRNYHNANEYELTKQQLKLDFEPPVEKKTVTPSIENNANIITEITDDRILNYLWYDVQNDFEYKPKEILIYYKNIGKNKDEKLQLLSDFLNNDYYKSKSKPSYKIINNWVQKHTIPSEENKEFGTYLHALIFINRYYLAEYDVENILSEEEKAAIEQKAEEERKKNEPLLTEADLKHLLKELKKEGGKEIDLTKGLTAFYEKLKTYAKENDERLIKSFIEPKIASIFFDKNNWFVINKFSLPTLTAKFEEILNGIKNRRNSDSDSLKI